MIPAVNAGEVVKPIPVRLRGTHRFGPFLLHPTHVLWFYRCMYFCVVCGRRAAHHVRQLQHPCVGSPGPYQVRFLRDLAAGVLPPGVSVWPDMLVIPSEYRIRF